jgi:hypothetical protein
MSLLVRPLFWPAIIFGCSIVRVIFEDDKRIEKNPTIEGIKFNDEKLLEIKKKVDDNNKIIHQNIINKSKNNVNCQNIMKELDRLVNIEIEKNFNQPYPNKIIEGNKIILDGTYHKLSYDLGFQRQCRVDTDKIEDYIEEKTGLYLRFRLKYVNEHENKVEYVVPSFELSSRPSSY